MTRFKRSSSFVRVVLATVTMGLLILGIAVSYQAVRVSTEKRSQAAGTVARPITGTFLMFDFDPTTENLNAYFTELVSEGIDTVITLGMGSLGCYDKEAWNYFDSGLMDRLVTAAKQHNITLFLGTGYFDQNDPQTHQKCMDPIGNAADRQKVAANTVGYINKLKQLLSQKGLDFNDNRLIGGFYIWYESAFSWFDGTQNYYRDISAAIHDQGVAPHKDIMISPYKFYNPVKYPQYLEDYNLVFDKTKQLIQNTDITIIAPQDSVGTQKVTDYNKNSEHYRALSDATKAVVNRSGKWVKAWANIESFQCSTIDPCSDARSTDFKTLRWQIRAAANHVEKIVTWIHHHTLATASFLDGHPNDPYHQYDHNHFLLRKALNSDYMNKPIIVAAFVWSGNQFWVKGYNIGPVGSNARFYLHYNNSSGQTKSYQSTVRIEATGDVGKTYSQFWIPIVNIPGFDGSKPFDIAIVNASGYTSYWRSQNPEKQSDPDFPELNLPNPTSTPVPPAGSSPTPAPPGGTTVYPLKKGSLTPETVTQGAVVSVSCDYGKVLDCVTPSSNGFSSCSFVTFEGTTAKFDCRAKSTQGSYSVYCNTFANTANRCAAVPSKIGTFAVNPQSTPTVQPEVLWVFPWNENFVIKGKKFGTPGRAVNINLGYGSHTYNEIRPFYVEGEYHVIYIPKSSLPEFDPNKAYTLKLTPQN